MDQSLITDIDAYPAAPPSPIYGPALDVDEEGKYIKRPPNAFMLFRTKFCSTGEFADAKMRQADISKIIGEAWRSLSPEDRLHWDAKAKMVKETHKKCYPHYVYQPKRGKRRRIRGIGGRTVVSAISF